VENWFDYVKNVSLAKYTADSVGRYMEQVSDDQINAIHSTGRRICGAFYEASPACKANWAVFRTNWIR